MICMLYVPCSNRQEAEKMAQHLLEEKLIACANILEGATSIYFWQGKLEQTQESLLLIKSLPEFKEKLEKRIKELHSYSCPAIIQLQVASVNQAYTDWVRLSLS